ncbi:hypothetical protein [Halococcoides cellulosivorans]|uniref:Uncharacterized protein n=1 Tax=Halococcoides cellulosivorans TaxID=1679096 RepID=A0A2R4WZS6_9EURY|nr:hypothetical protein [Halococcoides cellulosivorans]AWB27029.1 hypothetical protein HARCEL1_04555 [Halococcoides cellulosivorans]
MRLADWPVIRDIVEAGSRDPIFDALLVAGPVVIAILALTNWLVGDIVVTRVLAAGYIVAFLAGIGYRAVEARSPDR